MGFGECGSLRRAPESFYTVENWLRKPVWLAWLFGSRKHLSNFRFSLVTVKNVAPSELLEMKLDSRYENVLLFQQAGLSHTLVIPTPGR